MTGFAIIEAPSTLGLLSSGVERLPSVLLHAGLAERLPARRADRLEAPARDTRRDPATGFLNPRAIADYASALAAATAAVLDRGEVPIVLGGDCSILLGPLLALRRRGRFGLFFADGHTDFYQPGANTNGEVASSDLALATGRGPAVLTEFDGSRPLVRDRDVVAFGRRDEAEAAQFGSEEPPPELLVLSHADIRRQGFETALDAALARLQRPELQGIWLHFDADVLDDAIMPAVDYRLPGGLGWGEAAILLRRLRRTGRLVGLDVTIFNPTLDPGDGIAAPFAAALVAGLTDDDGRDGGRGGA